MRLQTITILAVAMALIIAPIASQAARDGGGEVLSPTGDEIVVFETENCIYCELFRRDVLPRYMRSPRARSVTIRFADAHRAATAGQLLKEPIVVVPTFILVRRGREVGRITGYTGPSPFFQMVGRLIKDAR